jgi:hypothetical protein
MLGRCPYVVSLRRSRNRYKPSLDRMRPVELLPSSYAASPQDLDRKIAEAPLAAADFPDARKEPSDYDPACARRNEVERRVHALALGNQKTKAKGQIRN